MQAEINELKKKVERLTKESDKWYSMYEDTYMKYKDAEISEAFSTFQSFREECEDQINSIKMRKRTLKAELKSGGMENIIEHDNKRLAEVDGIGPKRIKKIHDSWMKQLDIKDV